jgi:hypothetical protein
MNSQYLRELNQRPISYYPIYRDIAGSTVAGIVLSQLMYWFSIKDEIYKTDTEMMDETHLTPNELRAAKIKIKQLDFISVERRGVPAKTYYTIDWEKYDKCLRKFHKQGSGNSTNKVDEIHDTGLVKSPNQGSGNSRYKISEIHETITETTTETTTKSNTPPTPSKKSSTKKQNTPDLPDWLDKEAWDEWEQHRKEIGKKITPASMRKQLKLLEQYKSQQREIIEQSILSGWQGLFPPKEFRATGRSSGEPEPGSLGWIMQQRAKQGGVTDVEVFDE